MKVGIKYCGGCNPRYDRVSEVEKLKKKLPDTIMTYAKEEETYDWVILVCGCSAVCLKDKKFDTRNGQLIVCEKGDFDKVHKILAGEEKDTDGRES
jgi:hypothetical protein